MQAARPVTKPTKQRKMLYQAPDHIRHKFFAAPLSPEQKTSHKVKTLPVRTGDTVRIMRGDHKGFEGKITRIDTKKYRVYVEGLTREKVDGTTIFVPVSPSKVMITSLNIDDKWRKAILERKKGVPKKVEEVKEKPPKEVAELKEEAVEEKAKEEEAPEKKPMKRKRRAAKKPAKELKKEEKPKARKPRAKRKKPEKTEGGA